MTISLFTIHDPATDVPGFPMRDIEGGDVRSGWVYCGMHPCSNVHIYISPVQVTEIVRAGAPSLGESERALIARNLGLCAPAEHEELLADNVRLAGEVEDLREAVEKPLGELIDFFEERTKRRPEAVEETVA